MKIANNSTTVELHVPDFKTAKAFYGKLGFGVVWERKPEGFKGYMVMRMNSNILCFWAGNKNCYKHPYFKKYSSKTKRGYAVEIVLFVKNIKEYYKRVKKFADVVEPLILQPWGEWDFRIVDPFGYYIRFTLPHDILDNKNAVE